MLPWAPRACGAAAMAATWLDAFFPTAPFPNGTWVRETVERS